MGNNQEIHQAWRKMSTRNLFQLATPNIWKTKSNNQGTKSKWADKQNSRSNADYWVNHHREIEDCNSNQQTLKDWWVCGDCPSDIFPKWTAQLEGATIHKQNNAKLKTASIGLQKGAGGWEYHYGVHLWEYAQYQWQMSSWDNWLWAATWDMWQHCNPALHQDEHILRHISTTASTRSTPLDQAPFLG